MKTSRFASVAVVAGFVVTVTLLAITFTRVTPGGPKLTDAGKPRPDVARPPEVSHPVIPADEVAARDEAELAAMFTIVGKPKPGRAAPALDAQGERGKQVYLGLCYACHQPDGRGLPGAFPRLAQSDFMLASRERAIGIVLHGLSGPVTVNGQTLNSAMPPQGAVLTDEQIADVLTYVFNAWGNRGENFSAEKVKLIRANL
jgi:nitrite reductase (NO-forming)